MSEHELVKRSTDAIMQEQEVDASNGDDDGDGVNIDHGVDELKLVLIVTVLLNPMVLVKVINNDDNDISDGKQLRGRRMPRIPRSASVLSSDDSEEFEEEEGCFDE